MPIKADCSSCGHSFNAPSKYAGKKVRCPKCKEPLVIPAAKKSSGSKPAGSKVAVKCDCGKKFAAKAEWAGKKVKCPACSNPVRIPGGKASATKTKSKPKPKAAAAEPTVSGLFDEVGYNVEDGSAHRKCPECRAAMSDEAIICIECGYNENIGKKMETYRPVTAEDRAKAAEKPDPGAAGLKAAAARGGKSVPSEVSTVTTMLYVMAALSILNIGFTWYSVNSGADSIPGLDAQILDTLKSMMILIVIASIFLGVLPSVAGAYLLSKGKPIGRIIAMIIGGLSLFGFPIGTIIGFIILKNSMSDAAKNHCES